MTNMPKPTREKGQRSQDLYFTRLVPYLQTPEWVMAEKWRAIVYNQPIAMICRDTLISNFLSLDWKIEVRDSEKRDELKEQVEYYTDLFENGSVSYSQLVEWVGQDLLDLPFGGAVEVGREGDSPDGKVLWILPLDGGTLYPTLNSDFPVAQRVEGAQTDPVYFPAHAINRIYMTPRPEMQREGWGMAPPEKIYLALVMLGQGDRYYMQLLLDTPEAGILDLGDMSKESAEQWVDSFRSLMGGVDPFKIPVLYEHTNDVKFLSFTKSPNDIIYDRVTIQRAAITAAGYGMTLADVGFPQGTGGGDTLAGAIRSERRTRKTGLAVLKRLFTEFFNRLLPKELRFKLIDLDDEVAAALGRARLANSTAFGQLIDKKILSPKECRLQLLADGLVTISIPEDVPEDEFPEPQLPIPLGGNRAPERPGMLGNPQPPSTGGHGEASALVGKSIADNFSTLVASSLSRSMNRVTDAKIERMIRRVAPKLFETVKGRLVQKSDLEEWASWQEMDVADGDVDPITKRANDDLLAEVTDELEADDWWKWDIDENELVAMLSAAYMDAVERAAREVVHNLYVDGVLDSPFLSSDFLFKLDNPSVIESVRRTALDAIANVNAGSLYYIQRIVISQVRRGLISKEIAEKIRAGLDIQDILSDNNFMQSLSQDIGDRIGTLPEQRQEAISSYELAAIAAAGMLDQYRRMGLTKKRWEHVGSDKPCDVCVENSRQGWVSMDFQFRSVFGTTPGTPAHPHEHCRIGIDRGEAASLAMSGLYIWTGE